MHWFKRNIGDYHKKAGRLTMLQHGAYTLLMDACYDREQFPTKEEAIDWVWASTKEETEAVEFVLSKFFSLVDDKYVQHRIMEDVDAYQAKSENNKRIALEREAKRRNERTNQDESSTKRAQEDNETTPNQEPRTKNQEPETNNKDQRIEDAFNEIFWPAYHKKSNKAGALKSFKATVKREGIKDPNEFAEILVNDCRDRIKSNQLGFDNLHASTYLNNNRWEDEKQSEQVAEKFERPEWMRGIK